MTGLQFVLIRFQAINRSFVQYFLNAKREHLYNFFHRRSIHLFQLLLSMLYMCMDACVNLLHFFPAFQMNVPFIFITNTCERQPATFANYDDMQFFLWLLNEYVPHCKPFYLQYRLYIYIHIYKFLFSRNAARYTITSFNYFYLRVVRQIEIIIDGWS